MSFSIFEYWDWSIRMDRATCFAAFYNYADNGNVQKAQFHNPQSQLSGHDHYHQSFSYDGLNRLKSADYGPGSGGSSPSFDVTGLDYDAAGNIKTLQRRDDSGTLVDNLTYQYGGDNRLQSVSDAAGQPYDWDAASAGFGYDAGGNLTSQSGKFSDIAYDHRNLPVHFYLDGGDEVVAGYNADGQRILKELKGGAWKFYVQDGNRTLAVIQYEETEGSSMYFNLTGNGVFGRWEPGGARRYYLTDHLGSTRAVVDDNGTVLDTFDYYPFGLIMPQRETDATGTLEKFTGKERDDEGNLNLDYFGARYYDAALGRWHSTDPMEEYASPYVYVGNNPVRWYDIMGLMSSDTTYYVPPEKTPEVVVTAKRYEGDVQKVGGRFDMWLFGMTHHPLTAFGMETPFYRYRYFRVNNDIYVENIGHPYIGGIAPVPGNAGALKSGTIWRTSRVMTPNQLYHALRPGHNLSSLGLNAKKAKIFVNKKLTQYANAKKLKDGPNTIYTTVNGKTATIRVYFRGNELQSWNIFAGKASRKLGNIIDETLK